MVKARVAEWLIKWIGGHRRPAEIVGDLLERCSAVGGSFWWPLTRVLFAMCWVELVGIIAAPVVMLGTSVLLVRVTDPYLQRVGAEHLTSADVALFYLPPWGQVCTFACWPLSLLLRVLCSLALRSGICVDRCRCLPFRH